MHTLTLLRHGESVWNPRHTDLACSKCPRTECLKDNVAHFLPRWPETLATAVMRAMTAVASQGKAKLIAAR